MKRPEGVLSNVVRGLLASSAGAALLAGCTIAGVEYAPLTAQTISRDLTDLKVRLSDAGRRYNVRVETTPGKGVNAFGEVVDIPSAEVTTVTYDSMFASGSDQLSVHAEAFFREMAVAYRGTDQNILIVGHTDAQGSDAYNIDLSQHRALTVARLFAQQGISPDFLHFKGAGESAPVAGNESLAGRAQNRRVEVVNCDSVDCMLAYSYAQRTNRSFAPADPPASKVAAAPAVKDPVDAAPKIAAAPPASPQDVPLPTRAPDDVTRSKPPDNVPPPVLPAPQPVAPERPGIKDIPIRKFAFGGALFSGSSLWPLVGHVVEYSSVPFLRTQKAAPELRSDACLEDAPKPAGDVIGLRTMKPVSPNLEDSAYWTDLTYDSVWTVELENRHLVTLRGMAVRRHGLDLRGPMYPARAPVISIYEDYVGNPDPSRTPSYEFSGTVNFYVGSVDRRGLYRVFFDEHSKQFVCTDIVFPFAGGNGRAERGYLIYEEDNQFVSTPFTPVKSGNQPKLSL